MKRSGPAVVACGAGALIGAVYTASPMTVWFGVAMIALFAWARRGLEGRERLWVSGLLGTAVMLRLLALVAIFMIGGADGAFPVLIPDESYVAVRVRLLRYVALGIPLGGSEYMEMVQPYGDTGLHDLLAYLQLQLGDAPVGIRLFSVALYLTAGVTLYRTARVTFGKMAAFGGLAIVLFLPSMFVWSISVLKEPVCDSLAAIAVGAAMALVRTTSPAVRALAAVGAIAAVLAIAPIRPGGDVMVAGGILLGLVLALGVRKPVIALCTLLLCVTIAPFAVRSAAIQARATAAYMTALRYHVGYVNTAGWNYKLLDPEFYGRDANGQPYPLDPARVTPAPMARYTLRALASFVLVPLPWMATSPAQLAYLPEQIVWYALVMFAVIGIVSGLRKDPYLTLVLAGIAVVSAGLIAVTSGNIGTLVRHRSLVLMVLPWLSALGVCSLLEQFPRHRSAPAPGGGRVFA